MKEFNLMLNNILKLQLLKDCMMYRLFLIKRDYCTKTDYDKNEVDILALITESEINKIQIKITQLLKEFNLKYN